MTLCFRGTFLFVLSLFAEDLTPLFHRKPHFSTKIKSLLRLESLAPGSYPWVVLTGPGED